MTEQTYVIIILIILFVGDLIVVAARSSFISANYIRLLALRDNDEERANRTLPLILNLPRVRASFNFLLVFIRFLMAGLMLYLVAVLFQVPTWVTIIIVLAAALILFWFEWLIEVYTLRNPELWAMRFSTFARVLSGILSPVLAIPMAVLGESKVALEYPSSVTEDELRTLVDVGQEEGFVEEVERRMIHSIFRLSDTLVREIMVPRIDMLALDVNTSQALAVEEFVKSGYSRVPVYEDNVDNTLGVLYAKDLLRVWSEGGDIGSLRDLLRSAYFVPEAKRVDELLQEMQNQRIHIAIVVDEYGGVAGLVTLEDIVEEILGEIQDEYDQGEEMPYEELRDGDYMFLGRVDLDDFNDIMDCDLPADEADTLGGYIYSRLGRVPDVGEQIKSDQLLLTVDQVSARRIHKVRASWVSNIEDKEENLDHDN